MNFVIIPALNPDERLFSLVNELKSLGLTYIVVVDDGSNLFCQSVFQRLEILGCFVYHHVSNMGKGEAIKTGIRSISREIPYIHGYITADADGQHRAKDILRISEALDSHPGNIVLGLRNVGNKNVPRRSRFGNRLSALFFRLTTGVSCLDTQTGLRGFSSNFLNFALSIPGSRYEYEMNFLLASVKMKIPFCMVHIETVYDQNNSTSHFRPFVDSFRVCITFLKYPHIHIYTDLQNR